MRLATKTTAIFTKLLLAFACGGHIQGAAFTLEEATVEKINDAFDEGLLTSERLVQLYLNRIEAYDQQGPALNSIIRLSSNALEQARALDTERQTVGRRSLLHGIPVVIKENHDTFDMPTTAGVLALKDSVPPDDAFIVQRLREAGAVILGKTNLDEFSAAGVGKSSLGGQTLNAYDPARVPGGSSGGTGAAIAANFAVVGTGTDTIGSIREPSAIHALVGLRPTLGLVSRDGIVPASLPRDTAGPIARSVADLAATLDVIAGFDEADPLTALSQGNIPGSYLDSLNADALRDASIGVARQFFDRVEQDFVSLIDAAIGDMNSKGAIIADPITWNGPPSPSSTFYNTFHHDMNNYLESLGPDAPMNSVEEIIASGQVLESSLIFPLGNLTPDEPYEDNPQYLAAERARERARENILDLMNSQNIDVILYPSSVDSKPPLISSNPDTIWPDIVIADLAPALGFPAISVPIGFTPDGLPVGVELLGRPFSEPLLISIAYAYEQATGHRRPPATTPPLPGETISAAGDFNGDGVLDVADLDELTAKVAAGPDDLQYDLDRDGLVDADDREFWVSVIKNTFFGDTNLDGQVNAMDLNTLALSWQRTDATSWSQGDFNGDGNVNSADLNDLALNWRSGVVPAASAVPEPSGVALLLIGAFRLLRCRRRYHDYGRSRG